MVVQNSPDSSLASAEDFLKLSTDSSLELNFPLRTSRFDKQVEEAAF